MHETARLSRPGHTRWLRRGLRFNTNGDHHDHTTRRHRPRFLARLFHRHHPLPRVAGNSWVVLFSHPADFTPVCTTELGLTAKLKPEFDKRNVKAIALSVDPAESHASWIKDIEATQHTVVGFPIIADADRKVST